MQQSPPQRRCHPDLRSNSFERRTNAKAASCRSDIECKQFLNRIYDDLLVDSRTFCDTRDKRYYELRFLLAITISTFSTSNINIFYSNSSKNIIQELLALPGFEHHEQLQ